MPELHETGTPSESTQTTPVKTNATKKGKKRVSSKRRRKVKNARRKNQAQAALEAQRKKQADKLKGTSAAAAIAALDAVQNANASETNTDMDESGVMERFIDVPLDKMELYLERQLEKARKQAERRLYEKRQTNTANQEAKEDEQPVEQEYEAFKAQVDREVQASEEAKGNAAQLLCQQRTAQLSLIALRRKSEELPEGTPAKKTAQSKLEASHRKAQSLTRQALEAARNLLKSEGFSVSPGTFKAEDWGSPIPSHDSPEKQFLRDVQAEALNAQRAVIEEHLKEATGQQVQQLTLSRSLLDDFDASMREEFNEVQANTTPLKPGDVGESQTSNTVQKALRVPLPKSEEEKNRSLVDVPVHNVTDDEEQRLFEKMADVEAQNANMESEPAVVKPQKKESVKPQSGVRKAPLVPGRKAGMGLAIGGGFSFAFSAAASVYFISQASGLVGIPSIVSVALAGVSLLVLIVGVALLCKYKPGRVVTQSVLKRKEEEATVAKPKLPSETVQ